jgi:FlaA1/EpsC-like NDP-sugar epimerase
LLNKDLTRCDICVIYTKNVKQTKTAPVPDMEYKMPKTIKNQFIGLRLPEKLKNQLMEDAERNYRTTSYHVRMIVERYLRGELIPSNVKQVLTNNQAE